jgi:hypothetical protein
MRLALIPHPDFPSRAVTGLEVDVSRSGAALTLRYVATGTIGDLRLPPPSPPARGEGLWQHSCFEAFVRGARDGPYVELNFAPSTRWAAYRFSGYRCGMSEAPLPAPPRIEMRAGRERLELLASVSLGQVPDLDGRAAWRLGLSAIVEETDGCKSYWALAHPPDRPDFHHSDCFALQLPAAKRA